MTAIATDYDNIDIQQQYSDVNNRWDVEEWDNENSSARLFERSRIKALAGMWCTQVNPFSQVNVQLYNRTEDNICYLFYSSTNFVLLSHPLKGIFPFWGVQQL